jgi:hypothetical protein
VSAETSPEYARAVPPATTKTVKVFPFGVSRDAIFQGTKELGPSVELVDTPAKADVILTTKTHYRRKPEVIRAAEQGGKPIYVLRRNTQGQVEQFAESLSSTSEVSLSRKAADGLAEAEAAAAQVMEGTPSVELDPQGAYIRRLQHQLAERYNLASASTGREPHRRVIIYRQS